MSHLDWPLITFCLGIASILVACAVLVSFVAMGINNVALKLTEFRAKLASEIIQVVSALLVIGSTIAVADMKAKWIWTLTAAAISTGLWKIIQVCIDASGKKSILWYQELIKREEQLRIRLGITLALLKYAVQEKLKRLHRARSQQVEAPTRQVVKLLEEALLPKDHLRYLLQSITTLISEVIGHPKCNFRAGLYVDTDGHAVPISGHDQREQDADVFVSYQKHKERFELSNTTNQSEVVKCFQKRKIIIHSDCQAASGRDEFVYFNEHQQTYLGSMMVVPIGRCTDLNGKLCSGVLAIDSDCPGVFKQEEQENLEICLQEFSSRIKLELLLHAIIMKKGLVDEHALQNVPAGSPAHSAGTRPEAPLLQATPDGSPQ